MSYGAGYGRGYGSSSPRDFPKHATEGPKRLTEWVSCNDDVVKILTILGAKLELYEESIEKILSYLGTNVAPGVWLEYRGKVIGIDKPSGATDPFYRQLVKLRQSVNRSVASGKDLLSLGQKIRSLSGSSGTVYYTFTHPRAYILRIPNVDATFISTYLRQLRDATAAGWDGILQSYVPGQVAEFDAGDPEGLLIADDWNLPLH